MLPGDEGGRRPPKTPTLMSMALRVMTGNQGASRPEAVGWRAPLPFWALRAAKLCRVKRFLERAELSEVELVTTSSVGREGGAGGAGRPHPGPPRPHACHGPARGHGGCLPCACCRHPHPPQRSGSAQHPPLPFLGGPALQVQPSTPLHPYRGTQCSGLSPATTFVLLGGPGAPGSAQHPPWPFSGALGSGGGPPYPSRLSGSVFLSSNFFTFLVLAFEGLMTSDAWKEEENAAVSIHRAQRVGRARP